MGESESVPSAKQIGGTIPLFFYDLIGRIVPGTALIFGLLVYVRRDLLINWLGELQRVFPKESTAGYAAAMVLLFFAVAHFCGVILSSLSYLLIENLWAIFVRLTLRRFANHYQVQDAAELQTRFKNYFGTSLADGSLNQASALCAFYVWRKDANLGLMTARADAELLGARSLVLVCVILLVLPLFHRWTGWPPSSWAWFICVGTILISSILTFHYLRDKKVFMRCALFIAATSNSDA